MKKLLITVAALMVTLATAMAQGQVNFATRVSASGVDAKILDPSLAPAVTPPYSAALQVQGTDGFFSTIPGSTTTFRSGAAVGYVNPITVTIVGKDIGASAVLRVISYEGASFDLANIRGTSNPVTVTLGGGTSTPPDLVGLTGFTMVPEPSTIALGVLGAAALLLRRRK